MARVALALFIGGAVAQTPATYTISATSPGLSSNVIGVNLGHKAPEDSTWTAFMERSQFNGARMFGAGGVPTGSTIMAVAANVSGWVLGSSVDGTLVTSQATFIAAMNLLSVTENHTPKPTTAPKLALPWAAIDTNMAFRDASGGVSSWSQGSVDTAVSTLNALGIEPLLVQQLGCSSGPDPSKLMFSTMDTTNATYWTQRWEVYKHSYALASWAWRRAVSTIELENEPDFSSNNIPCWCFMNKWLDFINVRFLAAKNAFADLNADLASGKATIANGLCASFGCPKTNVTLNLYSSAFASTSYGVLASTATSPSCAISATGSATASGTAAFTGMNGATVEMYNKSFATGVASSTWKNFQSYSYHSYGSGGAGLASSALANLQATAAAAFPMQVYITEHARFTGASFASDYVESSDGPLSGSRLASQLISTHALLATANSGNAATPAIPAGAGVNGYIFKFSMTPINDGTSANLATALTSTSASPKMQTSTTTGAGVTLGLQKHGIHFGDNNGGNDQPFSIGDSTLSGEMAAFIVPALSRSKMLYNCTTAKYSGSYVYPCAAVKSADGKSLDILVTSDGSDTAAGLSIAATFNVAALNAAPSYAVITEVSQATGSPVYYGEVSQITTGSATITHTIPANGLIKLTIPLTANTLTNVTATADTYIAAGANVAKNYGSATTLLLGTSATAVHDTTGAAIISFPTADITSLTTRILLKLTVATPVSSVPTDNVTLAVTGTHIFQVLGLGPRTWTESALTWTSADFLTAFNPNTTIAGINQNFYKFGVGTNNSFVGHMSLEVAQAANTDVYLDVTDYVLRVAGCGSSVNFAIVRRFRHNTACAVTSASQAIFPGNECGTGIAQFPGDDLAGSTGASIFSKESAGKAPTLMVWKETAGTGMAYTSADCQMIGYATSKFGTASATASPPPPPTTADKPPPPSPTTMADKPPPPSPSADKPPPPSPSATADKPPPPSPSADKPPPPSPTTADKPPPPALVVASPPPPPGAFTPVYVASSILLENVPTLSNAQAQAGIASILNVPLATVFITSISSTVASTTINYQILASTAATASSLQTAIPKITLAQAQSVFNGTTNLTVGAVSVLSTLSPPPPTATPTTSPASAVVYNAHTDPMAIASMALIGVLIVFFFVAWALNTVPQRSMKVSRN